ncbi:MAG: enoyl-CoA hydratase/isomerase family protein [Actinomycetota bacterium]|nr:enoyl-CoA hydratase/isomerase family protein [Actinomycetota bacterium]
MLAGEPFIAADSLPVVVGWIGDRLGAPAPMFADRAVGADDIDRLTMTIARNPVASTSLAVLLRSIEYLPVDLGLAAESAVYSMLQTGEEFHRWRGSTEPVLFEDSIEAVHISGRGASFCSGGDLGEFGARADPATGHIVRLAQSPACLVHELRVRTSVSIHGMTLGGGAEVAAFAGHVVADPATRIGLPEIDLGLIPGAGGTVGVTRRIGRQRSAALALAVTTIDAQTALEWRLIDEIAGVHPSIMKPVHATRGRLLAPRRRADRMGAKRRCRVRYRWTNGCSLKVNRHRRLAVATVHHESV